MRGILKSCDGDGAKSAPKEMKLNEDMWLKCKFVKVGASIDEVAVCRRRRQATAEDEWAYSRLRSQAGFPQGAQTCVNLAQGAFGGGTGLLRRHR